MDGWMDGWVFFVSKKTFSYIEFCLYCFGLLLVQNAAEAVVEYVL